MAIHRGNFDENEHSQLIRELGEKLRSIREAQGLSIIVVSDVTKIQRHYLQAIEDGELSTLPRGPYVRGFVRQYCEFLSAADLWSVYDELTQQTQSFNATPESEPDYIASPNVFKSSSHWWIYLIILLSLGAAAWITWNYRGEITNLSTNPIDGGTATVSNDRMAASADQLLPAAQPSEGGNVDLSWMDGNRPAAAQTTALSADTVSKPAVQATAAKNVIRIETIASVWLGVSAGEQTLFRGTIKSGESRSFEVTTKAIRVRYGNPAGAVVTWNGSTANPLGPGSRPKTINYLPDGTSSEE